MFAGPNGSGKSTLKAILPKELLGVYLNPDEIEQQIRNRGFLDFTAFGLTSPAEETLQFFRNSSFLISAGLEGSANQPSLRIVLTCSTIPVITKRAPGWRR
jgi:hypothetical protein